MTFFFGLHLIMGGKLDVERHKDFFFWSSPIFLVEIGNCGPPFFKISGHASDVCHFFGGFEPLDSD